MAEFNLDSVLTADNGKKYKLVEVIAQQPPVVEPPVVVEPVPVVAEPEPQPETAPPYSTIPLFASDRRFASNVASAPITLPNGGVLRNKNFTQTGQVASIVTKNGASIYDTSIISREGIRIGGGGNFVIDGCRIEVFGTGADHADGIQAYSVGSRGDIKVRNSLIKCGGSATAGFFIADNWTDERDDEPTVDLNNVAFQEGPFGLRLHADVGGDIIVALEDVYFIGPFTYAPFYFLNYGGGEVVIKKWENVCEATIKDGKLIPGKAIPKP